MTKPSASHPADTPRGMRFGLGLVAIVATLAGLLDLLGAVLRDGLAAPFGDEVVDPALKLFGVAIVAWALLRAGDVLKFKYGGLEVQLGRDLETATETANENANALKAEIDRLKRAMAAAGSTPPAEPSAAGEIDRLVLRPFAVDADRLAAPARPAPVAMPTLPPPTVRDDVNKGRFGGLAERDGHRLSVRFLNGAADDRLVPIVLTVRRIDGGVLDATVHFFLHDTFARSEVIAPAVDGVAETARILIRGGFTVGAWVEGTGILLELDLALEPGAPTVVRTL